MKSFKEYLENIEESSLSKIYRKYLEHDSGTISAFNFNKYTISQNNQRTTQLKTDLLKLGYSVVKVRGIYFVDYKTPDERQVGEISFIVFDQNDKKKLKKDLFKLGEKYEQDCITYTNTNDGHYYLIGTNKDDPTAYPGYKVEFKLGKPMFGEKGDCYSKIKGRPFVFNKIEDEE